MAMRRFEFRGPTGYVALAAILLVPLYVIVRVTEGSLDKVRDLPELLDRFQNPLVWKVPEGGVRYLHLFDGEPAEGNKFVLVQMQMEARMKIGYEITPDCFRLVDDVEETYVPLVRSPLFVNRSTSFRLDRGGSIDDELLFEIPLERKSVRLLFDRYWE
jgi:hypothetical protein